MLKFTLRMFTMSHKLIYRAVLVFSLLAAFVFGAFMTASIALSADGTIADINTYSADKVKFFNLISWLYIACLVGFLGFTFVNKNRFTKSLRFSTKNYKYVSIIGGATTSGVVLYNLFNTLFLPATVYSSETPKSVDASYKLIIRTVTGVHVNWSYLLLMIATALSAFYFFYCVFSTRNKNSNLFAGLSMLPSVALAAKLIFDFLMQNSNGYGQLYNYHLLSIGLFLLFSVNESRFYMRKAAPALYVFFGLSGIISSFVFALPVLILSFTGVVTSNGPSIVFCLADVAISAYIFVRLFSLDVKIPKATKQGIAIDEDENDNEITA